ncbi:MAG: FAD-dependent monooxygenase [Cytophagales bacterium]|nr:FAD-dependent monooxygenase [Cytophagales bacterium]
MKHITITGAGLIGSLLSIYLGRKGYQVDVYESRSDMRKAKIPAGRSINLACSTRGWKALDDAGIGEEVRKAAIPMRGRMIHAVNGELSFQPYGKEDDAIYAVSRSGLNKTLMNHAEKNSNTTIHFNEKCVDVDLEEAVIKVENQKTGAVSDVKSDLVFGADGTFSQIRSVMQMTDRFNYAQTYIEHGYKELTIPPAADGSWAMEKNALHIWPRKHYMLIALPNADGSFTCTLFLPWRQVFGRDDQIGRLYQTPDTTDSSGTGTDTTSFDSIKTGSDLLKFFQTFPDAADLMPALTETYFANPTSSLCYIRCFPWTYKDKVAMIGDAAHAIVPFYGQGMIAGFEDITVLNELMGKYACPDGRNDPIGGERWETIFKEYEKNRKPNTDAISELALQNFIEMRDLVGDPKFLVRKNLERKIHKSYPDKFTPLYSMVMFSHIPYAEAMRIGKEQDKMLKEITTIEDIEQKWDSEEVESLIDELIRNKYAQSFIPSDI